MHALFLNARHVQNFFPARLTCTSLWPFAVRGHLEEEGSKRIICGLRAPNCDAGVRRSQKMPYMFPRLTDRPHTKISSKTYRQSMPYIYPEAGRERKNEICGAKKSKSLKKSTLRAQKKTRASKIVSHYLLRARPKSSLYLRPQKMSYTFVSS